MVVPSLVWYQELTHTFINNSLFWNHDTTIVFINIGTKKAL